jgi:hypothetical protein
MALHKQMRKPPRIGGYLDRETGPLNQHERLNNKYASHQSPRLHSRISKNDSDMSMLWTDFGHIIACPSQNLPFLELTSQKINYPMSINATSRVLAVLTILGKTCGILPLVGILNKWLWVIQDNALRRHGNHQRRNKWHFVIFVAYTILFEIPQL